MKEEMNKLMIYKGYDCINIRDFHTNIINITLNKYSYAFVYNYIYDANQIDLFLEDFINKFIDNINLDYRFYLYVVSDLMENTSVNRKRKFHGMVSNLFTETHCDILELADKLIKINIYDLTNKDDIVSSLKYLFTGYSTNSFIFNVKDDFQYSNKFIVPIYNRYNMISSVVIDYNLMTNIFNEIFFCFGGFDFGQFSIASF